MKNATLGPDHEISRVIRGNWQLAGGHGSVEAEEAIADMVAFADAGITTFDCADIYTGVEDLIGAFRSRYRDLHGAEALDRIRVHTKYVPDLTALETVTRSDVTDAIDGALRRLRTERLDLVQFHWWDYGKDRWRDVAGWLTELREAGKIRNLGGTNFDAAHASALIEDGVPLRSMQVQYSVLDTRPAKAMTALAESRDFQLLCYGSVAGGFLSDRWLGLPEPAEPLENRSLVKYKLIIDDVGGWGALQALLEALRTVADRHGVDIATVSSAWTLAQPQVAAVIVGARNRKHLPANLAVAELDLTADDLGVIDMVRTDLAALDGDVYALERDRTSRHGAVMKYNLNKAA